MNVIKKTLQEIANACGGRLSDIQYEGLQVHAVETDTRKLHEGCLFVPFAGEHFDGHDFVGKALAQGAQAAFWPEHREQPEVNGALILVDDPLLALQRLAAYVLRESGVRVVGVTGSNGKTTTKDMIAAVLSTKYKVHKTNGNFNNHIGLPLTILQMEPETDIIVLEMGMSSRGEIELLSSIACPEVAVITNIGDAHLLQLGSREEIARAKLEIISYLREGGLLISNGDEPLIAQVLNEASTVKPKQMTQVRFGFEQDNDIYATGIMLNARGTIFTTSASSQSSYFIPLLGQHNVANALAAMAVANYFDVPEQEIDQQLRNLVVTGMRTEVIDGVTGLTIINDAYNASPTAVRAALQLFDLMSGFRQKAVVLGDMLELGPEEVNLHRQIGHEFAGIKIDYLYTYGPLAAEIASAASAFLPADRVRAFQDKEELAKALVSVLTPRDLVLVKGSRGMRLEEVVRSLRDTAL